MKNGRRSFNTIIIVLAIVLGIAIITLVAFRQWLFVLSLGSMVCIPVIIYYSIKKPEIILFICLLFYFTHRGEKLANIVLAIYCVTILSYSIFAKHKNIKPDFILSLWGIISVLALLTLYKWNNWLSAFRGMLHFIVMPVIIYISIVKKYIDDKGAEKLMMIYIPLVIGYSLLQMLFYLISQVNYSSIDISAFHSSGFGYSWGVANTLAALMVLFSTILLSQNMTSENVMSIKLLKSVGISFSMFIAIIILSRGAILSLFSAVLVFYIIKGFTDSKFNITKLVVNVVGIIVVINVFAYKYIFALFEKVKNIKVDASSFSRLYMIHDCFIAMKANPVIGAGPNQYRYSEFYRHLEDPHNVFLRFGVDFGIVSSVLVAIIIFYPLFKLIILCRKKMPQATNIYSIFALPYFIAIINSQMEAAITRYHYGLIFWIIYAIMYSRIQRIKTMEEQTDGLNSKHD